MFSWNIISPLSNSKYKNTQRLSSYGILFPIFSELILQIREDVSDTIYGARSLNRSRL